MHGVYLNSRELDAMQGLTAQAVQLYCLLLRPLMDIRTGLVGVSSRVSWGRLALYLTPHALPGVARRPVTRWQAIRRALELQRAGLVRVRGSSKNMELVIALSLASKQAAREPHAGRTPSTEGEKPLGRTRGARRPQHVGDTKKEKTPPPHPLRASSSQEGEGVVRHKINGSRITLPPSLDQDSAERLVLELNALDLGQKIADELGAALASGKVRYPVRLARHFIKQARAGEFIPEHGPAYARARARAAAHRAHQVKDADAAPPVSRAKALEHIANMKKRLGKK